ncbi:MAG TPA: hypothetical protein VGL69_00830 [Solirubrobacteraceae bacterium]
MPSLAGFVAVGRSLGDDFAPGLAAASGVSRLWPGCALPGGRLG